MAPDSQGTGRHRPLPPDLAEALRSAVAVVVADPSAPQTELQEVLRRVAAAAHAQGMRAEELLVAFKQVVDEVPPPGRAGDAIGKPALRDHLVSMCIKAYYRG